MKHESLLIVEPKRIGNLTCLKRFRESFENRLAAKLLSAILLEDSLSNSRMEIL